MKYTAYYLLRRTVEFDLEEGQDLREMATAHARRKSGAGEMEIVQILPEGMKSTLGNDQPREPAPLPPPAGPPGQAPAVDQMDLRRAA